VAAESAVTTGQIWIRFKWPGSMADKHEAVNNVASRKDNPIALPGGTELPRQRSFGVEVGVSTNSKRAGWTDKTAALNAFFMVYDGMISFSS